MKLINAIKQKQALGFVPIIAEVKRSTPSAATVVEQKKDRRSAGLLASYYEQAGACTISIVCESKYFGGQPEIDIPEVLNKTKLPVLIKDFISSKKQVSKYLDICVDSGHFVRDKVAILLIAHHLKNKLSGIAKYCIALGICPVIEIQRLEDLLYVNSLTEGDFLIGFNNQSIDVLETKRNPIPFSKDLMICLRKRYQGLVISESGHRTAADVRKSVEAGADAVLVGTAFMQAEDPKGIVEKFVNSLEKEN